VGLVIGFLEIGTDDWVDTNMYLSLIFNLRIGDM